MWTWLLKFLPKISPLAEAQKLHYETQITLLNSEHETAIKKLETEDRNLRLEVERLKQELSKRPEPIHTSGLSEIETRILTFITEKEEPATMEIATHVGLSQPKLTLQLTDLEEEGFIYIHRIWPIEKCTIRQKGLRYLNERNLLK